MSHNIMGFPGLLPKNFGGRAAGGGGGVGGGGGGC
jgi:hypothetical protein